MMEPIKNKMKSAREFWDQKVTLRSLKAIRSFSDKRVRLKEAQYGLEQDWKTLVKADFESWLMDLEAPVTPDDPNSVDQMDLFTLLGEFASLRKEIHLQSREQAKNVKVLKDFNGFVDRTGKLITLMDEKITHIDAMELRIHDSAEEKTLRLFFDVRDSLKRGMEAGRKSAKTIFFWRRKKIRALVQGYGMALNKFDKALAMADTFPIITEGEKFDPETMRAVDRVTAKGMEPGMVHTEVSSGFIRKNQVILPAQVIVTE
ncbi:MAG: nucleotide exchange factor GrpE [Desulfobacteraceae bacterium]|nr:nucleotide exchange factor GrpE [Desulfobacteraceae bacterium]